MSRERFVPRPVGDGPIEPFGGPEEAWFWCSLATCYRISGASGRAGNGSIGRPCEPADILSCVERLWRNGTLDASHLAVLVEYGVQQRTPERDDQRVARLWEEAMRALGPLLVGKGIIAEERHVAVA